MVDTPQDSGPTRVYQLTEHLELREQGWWNEAIARTIKYEIFVAGRGPTQAQLMYQVVVSLQAHTDRHAIQTALEELAECGEVLLVDGRYHLSEESRQGMVAQNQEAVRLDQVCSQRYADIFNSDISATHVTWLEFHTQLVLPLTAELGARTLALLRGDASLFDTRAGLSFLDQFNELDRPKVQNAIVEFLDPSDENIRKLILGAVNHYMLVASSSLDRQTLQDLTVNHGVPEFHVLLDTNVIFSLLDLHRNPLNEATSSLLELVSATEKYAQIRLCVLGETLEEARESLRRAKLSAPSGRVTRNLAGAAVETGHFSGLVGHYLTASSHKGLSPSAYFDPYIEGLEIMLADLGVTSLDEDLTTFADRSRVKDRIDNWYSFEYAKIEGRSRKRITHDVLAMEYVSSKRGVPLVKLADAGWWFVTVDLWLQKQERKDVAGNRVIPVTINPAELVQLLRFWVPRSAAMEQALLGAIRLPFSFFAYDKKMERSMLRIVDSLSGYSNIETFSSTTIESVLSDRALRSALAGDGVSNEKVDEEVEAAVKRLAEADTLRVRELEEAVLTLEEAAASQTIDPPNDAIRAGIEKSKKDRLREIETLKKDLAKEKRQREASERSHNAEIAALKNAQNDAKLEAEKQLNIMQKWRARAGILGFSLTMIAVASIFVLGLVWAVTAWQLSPWVKALCGLCVGAAWLAIGLPVVRLAGLSSHRLGGVWTGMCKNVYGWIGAGVVAVILTFAVAPPPS